MDDLDRALLAVLRRNGRESIANLSAALGVARATVRARIEKLTREGRITGFTVQTPEDSEGWPVRGLTAIGVEGRGAQRVVNALLGLPEVQAVHATNGRWDLIVEIGAPDLPALDAALRKLRLIDGVASSDTSLLLSTIRPGARLAARSDRI
jgi:DNA-binding Lrp family transcriptional regulator